MIKIIWFYHISTVPLTCFFTHGAVLGFSVWSFEFGTNELAGEVFIHLARLPEISAEQEVEWLPEQTYSLLQNRQTSQSSVFQVGFYSNPTIQFTEP